MSVSTALSGALGDLREGLARGWMWHALALIDIRRRFTRSLLGPLWLTLNIALPTAALSLLFGGVLGRGQEGYLPYVAFGLVFWQFIQTSLAEGCTAFLAASEVIRNAALPLSIHIARLVWRNTLILAHNLAVVTIVLALMGEARMPHWSIIPALVLEVTMAGVMVLLLGIANARFRDIHPIVLNGTQLLFFVTPVFWYPQHILARHEELASFNPASAFIEIARAPLLGGSATLLSWAIALGTTAIAAIAALLAFAATRRRLVFWV